MTGGAKHSPSMGEVQKMMCWRDGWGEAFALDG